MKHSFFCLKHWGLMAVVGVCFALGWGCGSSPQTPSTQPSANPSAQPASQPSKLTPPNSDSVVTAPVDYIAASIRAGQQSKGAVEMAVFKKAVESFQAQEGRNPESLDELVQMKYVDVMPSPPVGQKYDYDKTTGIVKLVPK